MSANCRKPVAWAEVYDGKIASASLEKNRHHTVPLYFEAESTASDPLREAAPDMLAALKRLLGEADAVTISRGGIPGVSDEWEAAKVARAAIAKAEGRDDG